MKGEEMQSLRKAAQQALDALEIANNSVTPQQFFDAEIAALRAALEPVTTCHELSKEGDKLSLPFDHFADADKMVATIRPEVTVEPVAWLIESYDIYAKRTLQRLVFDNPKNMQGVKITAYYTAPPTSQESRQVEPVAWMYQDQMGYWVTAYGKQKPIVARPVTPLYTAPPKREPLTDEEALRLWAGDVTRPVLGKNKVLSFTRALERAHGIGGEE